jgi:predicted DNA-binding protein YlxM (UPF0122 family)
MERWKNVDGYEGKYEISDHGKVRSNWFGKSKILKTHKMSSGYDQLNLYKNKKHKKWSIHRLVAKHFIDNPDNKLEVNHKDGNKDNNHYLNLEWMTHSENFAHAYGNIFDNKGENHGMSKFTNKEVSIIKKRLNNGASYKELAEEHDCSRATINYMAIGTTWRHVDASK